MGNGQLELLYLTIKPEVCNNISNTPFILPTDPGPDPVILPGSTGP